MGVKVGVVDYAAEGEGRATGGWERRVMEGTGEREGRGITGNTQ